MQTFSIRTPEDIDVLVRRACKFAPEDSFVIVPVGVGGAFARVDLDTPDALRGAFSDARGTGWTKVLVAIYTDGPHYFSQGVVESILPGVEVVAVITRPNPTESDFREGDLVALTLHVTDVTEAETRAWQAYWEGDGALAWRYLARARDLGTVSADAEGLALLLRTGIDPHHHQG